MNRRDFFKNIKFDGSNRLIMSATAGTGNIEIKNQRDFYDNVVISNGKLLVATASGSGSTEVKNQRDFFENVKISSEGYIYVDEVPANSAVEVKNQRDYFNNIRLSSEGYLQVYTGATSASGTQSVVNEYNYYKDIDFSNGNLGVALVGSGGAPGIPVADFSADDTTLTTAQVVTFTDTSTNTPTSWLWDFGDGNTSTTQNPTHSYAATGSYTVGLTASNAEGGDNETKLNYIEVGVAPQVSFTSNSTGCVDEVISFTSSATASSPTYQWDFGDGNTSTAQNPTHSYSSIDNYVVGLTATDNFGSDYFTSSININDVPGSSFSASTYSTSPDTVITFTDTSTNTPTSWLWDFGDGNTSTSQNPTHSYSATGSYTVGLTASNECGDGNNVTDVIDVTQVVAEATIIYNRPPRPAQDTSYRTGDTAWHIATGSYASYDQATSSNMTIQTLDFTQGTQSYMRLKYDNEFGNKARFTTATGSPALEKGNNLISNYIIDHYTGLAYAEATGTNSNTWNQAIDAIASHTYYDENVGVTYSDFRPVTLSEMDTLYDTTSSNSGMFSVTEALPFSFYPGPFVQQIGAFQTWTGVTDPNDTTYAFRSESSLYQHRKRLKANATNDWAVCVRTHY